MSQLAVLRRIGNILLGGACLGTASVRRCVADALPLGGYRSSSGALDLPEEDPGSEKAMELTPPADGVHDLMQPREGRKMGVSDKGREMHMRA